MTVHVHDPHGESAEAEHEYGIALTAWDSLPAADALVLAVAHREYLAMPIDSLLSKAVKGGCVIDVKSALDRTSVTAKGLTLWRL